MEPRPATPDVDQIVRALEQRVDRLHSVYAGMDPKDAFYVRGRLEEAQDTLDNIRVMQQPAMEGASSGPATAQ